MSGKPGITKSTHKSEAIAMTQFINRKEDIVQDAIDGVIAASGVN
jgi:hypothetical protein